MTAKGDTVKFNMLYVIRVYPYTYIYKFKHIYCIYIGLGQFCIKNLKLENIQFVVDSFYLKKWKDIFKQNFLAQLACEFAWICEYLEASCIQHF